MSNTTKEGIEVKPGQIWEDLDKRMKGRLVKVILIDVIKRRDWRGHEDIPCAVVARPCGEDAYTGRSSKIAIRRMHKHSTGFKLIKDV